MTDETEEKRSFVAQQFKAAKGPQMIPCGCGRQIPVRFMFRCLYCGQFYCKPCAEEHFGTWNPERKQ